MRPVSVRQAGGGRLGFLFNHDTLHQIAHTAPIISELVQIKTPASITILTSSAEQEALVRSFLGADVVAHVQFVSLSIDWLARLVDRFIGKAVPVQRVAMLLQNRAIFADLDVLVVPETTSTMLKTRFGLSGLGLVYVPHGAGDRSIGFRNDVREFDFVLLSGTKVRDRMLNMGLITEAGHAIVGYPKFDTIGPEPEPVFTDGKPVVVYNPHFDPYLSSWYKMGERVLEQFAAQDRFNLIFAPHVMMHRRKYHLSVEHFQIGAVSDLAEKFMGHANIHIDTGSARSSDMSYTRQADIYLGDASSQVYEFLLTPRPCIFLNSHDAKWQGNPDYGHWALGEVLGDVAELPAALDRAVAAPDAYRAVQEAAVNDTFALSDIPSSRRAAQAIAAFLARP